MKITNKPIKTVTVDDKQFNIHVFSHRYLVTDSNNDLFIDPFTLPLANDKTITDSIQEKITDAILKKIVTKKVDELNNFIYPSSLDEDSNEFYNAMDDRYENGHITISFTVNDECKSIRLPFDAEFVNKTTDLLDNIKKTFDYDMCYVENFYNDNKN